MSTNIKKERKLRDHNKSIRTNVRSIIKTIRQTGITKELESEFVRKAKKVFHWKKVSRLQSRLKIRSNKIQSTGVNK